MDFFVRMMSIKLMPPTTTKVIKMPKNNKTNICLSTNAHFSCACGVYKEFNDEKSMMSAKKRHIKYCEVGKNSDWERNDGRNVNFDFNTGKTEIVETDEWKIRCALRKL